jgi:hypothetical protein
MAERELFSISSALNKARRESILAGSAELTLERNREMRRLRMNLGSAVWNFMILGLWVLIV